MTTALRRRLPLLAVLTAIVAVFARGLAGELVYDDLVLIQRNPALHDPLDLGALALQPLYGAEQGYWRPLTSVALAWGNALAGTLSLHALALAIHVAVVVQVAGLGRDLGLTRRATLWGALLFGVCPVVVEPVAWIAAINDPLWALCGLIALRAHLRWRRDGSAGLPWRASVWLAVGLLAKENALSIGLLFVALDVVVDPARLRGRALLRAYGAYAIVALAWLGARAAVLGATAAGAAGPGPLADPLLRRVEVTGRLVLSLIVPLDPTPFVAPAAELDRATLVVAALVLSLLAVVLWSAIRCGWRPVVFAVLAFVAVVSPAVVRLDALGPYPIADRYLYLGAAAAALALAWTIDRLPSPVSTAALATCAVGCGALSTVHVGVWADQEALVGAGLDHHPEDPRMHYMLGQLRLEAFAAAADPAALDAASRRFRVAQRLLDRPPWNGAAAAAPLRADTELGIAWCELAAAGRVRRPDWRAIIADFERIAAAHPGLAPAQVGLGVALASADRTRDARAAFERAVVLDPRLFEARVNLARALAILGEVAQARRQLDEALRLRPGDPTARAMRSELGW